MVHFSGKARKMNTSSSRASEASARTQFEFDMYGFKNRLGFPVRFFYKRSNPNGFAKNRIAT
ncbi:MAG: hypothetical protein U5L45_14870 [Saprospiraceae bacterium]|nr:hypothetical protein [Saprospiraceae bacterium]